jgi:hypothetical protein
MENNMKRILLVIAIVALAGCDRGDRGMETKTYVISRLTQEEALQLLTPYIREGGYLSGKSHLITVREKPDRIAVIDDLLKKYDGGGVVQDVAMRIQIVEANGFTARDSSIADIEQTLREMFKYRGYRMAGEALVRAREGSTFEQQVSGYKINGAVGRLLADRGPISITLWDKTGSRQLLSSTVTATMSKPVVLGQSSDGGAIILVIRPSLAGT